MMHGWYKALDAAIPSASFKASIVKLCLDQSIAAPTLIASFFVVVGVLRPLYLRGPPLLPTPHAT
jgi:hypothetical protein